MEREIFITHIGKVTINDHKTVIFEANSFSKVIVHADTIYEIAREVRAALKDMKNESKRME
jgi:hypothetical protein